MSVISALQMSDMGGKRTLGDSVTIVARAIGCTPSSPVIASIFDDESAKGVGCD
jgi:hypothetical protein